METQVVSFEFVSYRLKDDNISIELNYAVEFADKKELSFTEVITLPEAITEKSENFSAVLDKTIQMLHFVCGISYWKAYCPPSIVVRTKQLTKAQAHFWNTVYTKGLGEFFYRNKIDYRDLVKFPYDENEKASSISLDRQEKAIMSVGGGKDSIVTFGLLKKIHIPTTAFVLETQKNYPLIDEVIEIMDISTFKVKRHIDPQLFELNKKQGVYNGHVPITSLYSIIGILLAVVYDYKYVVMSNEESANYGNVDYLGSEINHQWSKSAEFEGLLSTYIKQYVSPNIFYFSLLRPFTEIKVVSEFTKFPKYFSVFSSCNNNFKIYAESNSQSRWCGHCPKCAFVFSMLAAYLPKKEVVQIFGKNLYEDEKLASLYEELLGIKDVKPFECVGTPDEVKAAFYFAYKKGDYNDTTIMKLFENEILLLEEEVQPLFSDQTMSKMNQEVGNTELIPDKFKSLLEQL